MSKKYKPLEKWNGILKGEHPIFILGNGPSLTDNELSLLDPYLTIGINRVFNAYEPTILFWQDRTVWFTSKKEIDKTSSIKVTRKGMVKPNLFPDYLFFVLQGNRKTSYPPNPRTTKLHGQNITSGVATQFAEAMHPSHIILLGVDCQFRDGQTDFYGNNRFHRKDMLSRCAEVSRGIKRGCKVPIYNCGLSDCWRTQKLEDVIKEIDAPKHGKEYFDKFFRKGE
jgi:hypothetical protein